MLKNKERKKLCLELIYSETEEEIIHHLKTHGLWDKSEAWRWLGDEQFNYSSIGNQQSQPEQAIVEKLVNSIDAKLVCQARIARHLPLEEALPQSECTPKSIEEARIKYFGKDLKCGEDISKSITVAATAKGIPSKGYHRPCFTIADNGEGQTPRRMPETMLSLHKGNKDKIKFVQGKFNMGGTGVLEFCGMKHNIQLVISKRHPDLIPNSPVPSDKDWSFTIIRREDPSDGKSSRYAYLAPLGCNNSPKKGQIIHFSSDSLPIFPYRNQAYSRNSAWGTLIKLFEYDAKRIKRPITLQDGLMYRARLLLPEPALPIRFYECRPFDTKKGSTDALMPGIIKTLKNDYKEKRGNIEWHDRLKFVVNGESFLAELFLFKDKTAADNYRSNEGILFNFNGQCHATIPKDFFRRKKVKLEYLRHSLLMFVDCSKVKSRTHEQLFMNSRDRLREGELKAKLEERLVQELFSHSELKTLASERRKKGLSQDSKTTESMAKVIENLLSNNPTLASLLQQGSRIRNPHKPENIGKGDAGFKGKRFPTRFHFKGKNPNIIFMRDANIGSTVRLEFETDAQNDYFKRDEQPGDLTVYGKESELTDYQQIPRLRNGIANLSMELPNNAEVGKKLDFVVVITDPSRPDPFKCKLQINLKPPKNNPPGGKSGGSGSGNTSGTGKGSTGVGRKQLIDSKLDIPEPQYVYEKDWDKHEPKFDRQTAIQIKDHPETKPDEERYDYFINMDNVYLQTYMKAKPKEANNLKLKFSVSMTLVALSVLHHNQLMIKNDKSIDSPSNGSNVQDRVAETTSAIAPFLLPMIESISILKSEEETD